MNSKLFDVYLLEEEDMSSTSGMNIILGQANAIKEVHNVTKQNLELNQQLVAQNAVEKRREDKSKVKKSESGDRVEINTDEDKKEKKDAKDDKERLKKEKEKNASEGSFIDIKV